MEEEIQNIEMLPQPASSDEDTKEDVQGEGRGEMQDKEKVREKEKPREKEMAQEKETEMAQETEKGGEGEVVLKGSNLVSCIGIS